MFANFIYFAKRPFHFFKTGLLQGLVSEIKYKYPAKKLKILAITGTDGKTTSSTMLYQVLKAAGKKVALLSTVAAYIGNEAIDTGFHVTSPGPQDLHQFLAMMVDQGVEYVVMETTSHGIYQYRTWGISPLLSGVTNISHEHLDYHINYKNYLEAKAELLQKAKFSFINGDDISATPLRKKLRLSQTPFNSYSSNDELPKKVITAITKRFSEQYNQMNARLVYAFIHKLGIDDTTFAKAIAAFTGVPGRMEVVTEKPVKVIVDFAHTPQALEAALTAIIKTKPKNSKVIAVFGCAGLRDRTKRPKMGKIASELADHVIFTAEDPRTENLWSILNQMKGGVVDNHHKVLSIPDRGQAINKAIVELAADGDIVSIFGKGHEKSMCFGTEEIPWDDREAVKKALKNRAKAKTR